MSWRITVAGVLLALLWLLWPGPSWAAGLGAAAFLAMAAMPWTPLRPFTWVPLGVGAATTMLMPAGFLSYRAWLGAALMVFALDAVVAPRGRDEDRSWVPTVLSVAGLGAGAFVLAVYRPARASLLGPDAVLPAALLVAGVATAMALFLPARATGPR